MFMQNDMFQEEENFPRATQRKLCRKLGNISRIYIDYKEPYFQRLTLESCGGGAEDFIMLGMSYRRVELQKVWILTRYNVKRGL